MTREELREILLRAIVLAFGAMLCNCMVNINRIADALTKGR